jgi:hypothetical protein
LFFQNSKLKTQNSKLKTQNSKLKTQNCMYQHFNKNYHHNNYKINYKMRRFFTLFLIFITLSCINAQTETRTMAVVGSLVKPNNPIAETPDQARKQVVEVLIELRKSIGIETEYKDISKGSLQDYADFIHDTKNIIEARLLTLNSNNVKDKTKQREIYDCNIALNILKSASCLTDKVNGAYVKQNDLEGREIVAYNLGELKDNARYGFLEPFREGFSRIKKDQVYGFLNYCGDEIITCQYETAQPFNYGRALVKKVNWFFIDAMGKESDALANVTDVMALKYGITIAQFSDGKYALIDNRYDLTKSTISEKYDEIVSLKGTELFKMRKGNKIGLMTIKGEVKLETAYDNIEPSNLANIYRITQNGKIGFMNNEWRVQFAPTFDEVGDVDVNGNAVAKEGNKFRLISFRTFQKSEAYNKIGNFGDKKITTMEGDGGLLGLINTDFNVIVTPQYFTIGQFNNFSLAEACKIEKKCGYINEKGIEVIAPIYEEVGKFNTLGVVVVKELTKDCNKNKNCKTDIVYNKYGQVIIAKAHENEYSTMKIHYVLDDVLYLNKYISVQMFIDDKPDGFHLVDAKTFRLITNTTYNSITPYDVNGIIRIKKGDKWGMIDTLGAVVLAPTYKEIRKGTEGYYGVKNEDGKYGFIDRKCKIVIPFEYDDIKYFRKGNCIVLKGKEKWGLINKYNAKIVPPYFKSVEIKESVYELMDDKGTIYIVDDKGDCQGQNCGKFEEIRKKANN